MGSGVPREWGGHGGSEGPAAQKPGEQAGRLGAQTAGAATRDIVAGLQQRAGLPSGAFKAMDVWRSMRDPRLRKHVVGLALRQNRATRELIAYVDGSVWKSEFSMLSTAVLVEWNHLCEQRGLDMQAQKVSFKLSKSSRRDGASGGLATYGPEVERPPVELDADERARVQRTVEGISDERVRRQAAAAMTSIMEWRKGQVRG